MGMQFENSNTKNPLPLFGSIKIESLNDYVLYLKEFSSLQHLRGNVDIVFVVQQHYLQQLTLQPRGQQLKSPQIQFILCSGHHQAFCRLPFLLYCKQQKATWGAV